jgi:hypothetical protein
MRKKSNSCCKLLSHRRQSGINFVPANFRIKKEIIIGVNASYLPGLRSFDLNNAFEWVNYYTGDSRAAEKQLHLNLAISRNIFLPDLENWIFSPVQKFSLVNNNPIPGESDFVGYISPGIQFVYPHLKIEGLYQFTVNNSKTSEIEYGNRLILGLRLMF